MKKESRTIGVFDKSTNHHLIKEIMGNGSNVYKLPPSEIIETDITTADKKVIENLDSYDWLIFTDVFSVDYFISKLEANNKDVFDLDNLRICSYGEAVADRLRFSQIHSDVIANTINDEFIFQQIKEYINDIKDFQNLNVFLVKGMDQNLEIQTFFKQLNSIVTVLNVYASEKIENLSKIMTLIKGGVFDEFVFCSIDEVFEFSIIFYQNDIRDLLDDVIVSALDSNTHQTLHEMGIKTVMYK